MNSHKYLLLLTVAIAIITPSATGLLRGNYCWQMIPVLGSASILLLVAGLGPLKLTTAPWIFPASLGLGLIGAVTSAILFYLYPIFTLPVPTGRYAVGTISIDLVDKSRIELCDPTTTTANRELVVRVWYPAIANNSPKTPYIEDPRLVPSGLFSHLRLVKTHAIQAAPIATTATPYPIIIYTPSWGGSKTDNTFQTQELASHGYVAIGLEHACSVPIAIYSSGRVIRSNLAADYTSSDAAMAKFLTVARSQLDLRTQDVRFILDRLPELNAAHQPLTGKLNLDKIGIFGPSFGGAVAAQACSLDARLKAGLNMDGLMFSSSAQTGATQPFLFMNSDYPRPTAAELRSNNERKRRAQQTDEWGFEQRERWFQQHGGYNLTILGAAHMNFSDYPLKSRFGNGSKISPERAMQIINRYTVAFFDRHLKEIDSPLLTPKSPSPFAEVIFQKFRH